MKLFKKVIALVLAGTLALGSYTGVCAFADSSVQTTADENTEAGNTEAEQEPEEYQPADTTGFIRWTAKTNFTAGKNYYINSTVKLSQNKSITLPKDSTLILSKGANLQIYAGSVLNIKGKLIIEPGAKASVTGTLNLNTGSSGKIYGSLITTKSGTLKVSSDLSVENSGTATLAGTTYIYKTGSLENSGKITVSAGASASITGKYIGNAGSQLSIKGRFAITLSGTASISGYLLLSGELVNSGVLTFELDIEYKKMKTGRLAVSKSGRFVDMRNGNAPGTSSDYVTPPSSEIRGIDVSEWQGIIDWKKVKAAGIEFAMIRTSISQHTDKTYEYNITEAKKAGIKIGAYHFCYAETPEEARAEAKVFLDAIAPYEFDYPIVIDIETGVQSKLGKEKLTEIATIMLEAVKEAGYYPMLYSSTSWFLNLYDMSKLQDYDLWVADWRGVLGYTQNCGMWQYSCTGRVSGITGDVDLNICYKDYEKIIREGGYNKPVAAADTKAA